MTNKKILGTKTKIYKNIKFKSTLECNCYKLLENSGLEFSHEAEKTTLQESFKPTIDIWAPSKVKGINKLTPLLEKQTGTLIKITYTPDFIVIKGNYKIYIEAKGKPNDVYPYKKKLFLHSLELKNDYTYIFMEPHNLRQMKQAIEIINNL